MRRKLCVCVCVYVCVCVRACVHACMCVCTRVYNVLYSTAMGGYRWDIFTIYADYLMVHRYTQDHERLIGA